MDVRQTIEDLAAPLRPAAAAGVWRPVVLRLDRAASDVLTVGVVFQPNGTGATQYRLLRNVAGVRCLFGPDGASNAAFAIDQFEAAFREGLSIPDGWNITLGVPAHASGESADAIISKLFQRVVPLARHEEATEDMLDADDHKLSTVQLRRHVREIIRKRFGPKKMPDFWHDAAVNVSAPDGRPLSLDLQIFVEPGTAPGVAGSIVSTWYTSRFYRENYLNSGFRSLTEAREVMGDRAKADFYVLRPLHDQRFKESHLREIDNEIDGLQWLLKKRQIDLHTFDNEQSLAEGVLAAA